MDSLEDFTPAQARETPTGQLVNIVADVRATRLIMHMLERMTVPFGGDLLEEAGAKEDLATLKRAGKVAIEELSRRFPVDAG